MARWKLTQPHYLSVPGTYWEQIETTPTGQQVRKQYPVPKYLHHEDPTCWNYIVDRDAAGRPVTGDVVVCYEGKGQPRDILFTNPPTPDMIPLDEEAQAISAKLGVKAGFRVEEAPEGGYAGMVLENLGRQLADAMAATTSQGSGSVDKLCETINKMMEQQAQLLATLVSGKSNSDHRRA